MTLTCKCCGRRARWCGDGPNGCGNGNCDHIHCDHCGMHYSLESADAAQAETMEEARGLMLAAYDLEKDLSTRLRTRVAVADDVIEDA